MLTEIELFVNANLAKLLVYGIIALVGIGAAIIGMAGGAE